MTELNDTQWEYLKCWRLNPTEPRQFTPELRKVWDLIYTELQRLAWRPISEAPRDGTRILVSGGTVYWKIYGWFSDSAQSFLQWEPTHFMLLPPLPKEGE